MLKQITWAARSYLQPLILWLALGWGVILLLYIATIGMRPDALVPVIFAVIMAWFPAVVFNQVLRRQLDWSASRFYSGFTATHLAVWAALMTALWLAMTAVARPWAAGMLPAMAMVGLGVAGAAWMSGATGKQNIALLAGFFLVFLHLLAQPGSHSGQIGYSSPLIVIPMILIELVVLAAVTARFCRDAGRSPIRNADALSLSRQTQAVPPDQSLTRADKRLERFLASPRGGWWWRWRRDHIIRPPAGWLVAILLPLGLAVGINTAVGFAADTFPRSEQLADEAPAILGFTSWFVVLLPWIFFRGHRPVMGHELLRPVARRDYFIGLLGKIFVACLEGVVILAALGWVVHLTYPTMEGTLNYDLKTHLVTGKQWPEPAGPFLFRMLAWAVGLVLLSAWYLRLAWMRSNMGWCVLNMPAAPWLTVGALLLFGSYEVQNPSLKVGIYAAALVAAFALGKTGWRRWLRQEM